METVLVLSIDSGRACVVSQPWAIATLSVVCQEWRTCLCQRGQIAAGMDWILKL